MVKRADEGLESEAARWFVRWSDTAAPVGVKEQSRWIAWLQRSPRHVAEYFAVDDLTARLSESAALKDFDVDAWMARRPSVVVPLDIARVSRHEQSPRRSTRGIWLIAATFAVMTVGAVAYWELFGRADSYRTDLGEQRTVHLNDGSVLQLNTRSRVRVAFNKRAREIDLEGEALFAVAPDTQRPFVVRTHDATVRAIGTEFNVYEQEGSTRVTVLEGRVEVSASSFGQPFELGSGEAARVTRDTTHKEPNANVKAATAWQSRTLVFERARLADVAHEFNRYNRMQFRIDAALGDSSRLSGTFDARHPESLVLWLQSRPDLTVTREGDAYRVQQVAAHE